MFLFRESSLDLLPLCERYSKASSRLREALQGKLREVFVKADEDISSVIGNTASIVVVQDGALGVSLKDARLCALEDGEVFIQTCLTPFKSIYELYSDFAIRLEVADHSEIHSLLSSSHEAFHAFTELQQIFLQIMGSFLRDTQSGDGSFDPSILHFRPGDIIIEQGSACDDVYTLAQGELEVLVDGIKVGDIREGEVFGVIAAFTGTPRTASIRSTNKSMVLRLPKDQFDSLVKSKPSLVTSLVESLSRTIVELDAQVLAGMKSKS